MNEEITLRTLHAAGSITADRLLLSEITHRVSNELETAIGIAAVEIARAGSEEITLSLVRIKRCLEGFARVHQVLRIPQPHTRVDACAYLRALWIALQGLISGRRGLPTDTSATCECRIPSRHLLTRRKLR